MGPDSGTDMLLLFSWPNWHLPIFQEDEDCTTWWSFKELAAIFASFISFHKFYVISQVKKAAAQELSVLV